MRRPSPAGVTRPSATACGSARSAAGAENVAYEGINCRTGEYRFISPEWNFRWRDNTGKWHETPRLFAAALTNRPFFEEMGPVHLCDQGLHGLLAQAPGGDDVSAAKEEETMSLKAIAESLGLAADAAEDVVLAKLREQSEERDALKTQVEELSHKKDDAPELEELRAFAEAGRRASE